MKQLTALTGLILYSPQSPRLVVAVGAVALAKPVQPVVPVVVETKTRPLLTLAARVLLVKVLMVVMGRLLKFSPMRAVEVEVPVKLATLTVRLVAVTELVRQSPARLLFAPVAVAVTTTRQ